MNQLGADVDALDALTRTFDHESHKLIASMNAINATLHSTWWAGVNATRFEGDWRRQHATSVRSVAQLLTGAAHTLRTQSQQQRTVSSDSVPFTLVFEFALVTMGLFASLTPAEQLAFLRGMSADEQRKLLDTDAARIATLDGAPVWLRDEANRHLMRDEIARSRAELASLQRGLFVDTTTTLRALTLQHHISVLDKAVNNHEYQILKFDPQGDGRLIAVFGNLEHAKHVAILVPGVSNSAMDSLSGHGVLNDARTLSGRVGSDTAVVAWLDYDAPDNALVGGTTAPADAGAPALRSFVTSVRGYGATDVTVIAHSYGSVLAGHAATSGRLDVDHLIIVGSPGTGADHASDFNLHPGADVWVGHKRGDKVEGIGNFGPIDVLGPDPSHSEFGAQTLRTSGGGSIFGSNHNYYEGASLDHMVQIVGPR